MQTVIATIIEWSRDVQSMRKKIIKCLRIMLSAFYKFCHVCLSEFVTRIGRVRHVSATEPLSWKLSLQVECATSKGIPSHTHAWKTMVDCSWWLMFECWLVSICFLPRRSTACSDTSPYIRRHSLQVSVHTCWQDIFSQQSRHPMLKSRRWNRMGLDLRPICVHSLVS